MGAGAGRAAGGERAGADGVAGGGEAARAAVRGAGGAKGGRELSALYDAFQALVTGTVDDVVARWAEQHDLAPRLAAVAKVRELAAHGTGSPGSAPLSESAFRDQVLTRKRAQLAALVATIETEEKRCVQMRVELAQQKEVMLALASKIRAREEAIGNTVAGKK